MLSINLPLNYNYISDEIEIELSDGTSTTLYSISIYATYPESGDRGE